MRAASVAEADFVTVERDIAAGEEVLISYGQLSSGDLLTAYGFVEEPGMNPHDSIALDSVSLMEDP